MLQLGVSTAIVAAYAVPYALRAQTLRRRGRPVPRRRVACFASGLVVLAVAVSPPFGAAADRRLTAHMLEHLLLGDVAPLLIVLGLTGPLLAPVLRVPLVGRARALTHPVIALALWAAGLYAWHLRVAYEAAIDHELVHVAEHACFFLLGANVWFALLGPLPKPAWFSNGARLGYVLVVRIAATLLAYTFVWSGTVFYPHYRANGLADQSAAGAVMLVEESIVMVALFAWLLARTLRDAGCRQELAELAAQHGVRLDERRIARAVAADQGAALMESVRRLTGEPEGTARGG